MSMDQSGPEASAIAQLILDCGAAKAAVISRDQISMSASFRKICASNQCGGYGSTWVCPPHVGEIDDLMEKVRSYPRAVLYQSIHTIEDSFDIEGMFAAGGRHKALSQKIHLALKETLGSRDFLHLSCGGCSLCKVCAIKTNEPCRHPDQALSSMEAYGIDVSKTSRGTGLNYINGSETVTYFGIVLIME